MGFYDMFERTVIIGEMGINHNGSLEIAKRLVDVAVEAGVDVVKTQLWSPEELFSNQEDPDNISTKDYALSHDDMRLLKDYCDTKGIMFLCTADDEESLDFLVDELKVCAIKVGSGELNNLPFLRKIALKKLPIILSTGMSTLVEVSNAIITITSAGNEMITLMHCTSTYPAPLSDVNLRAIKTMKEEFDLPVGYSDHTEGLIASYSAVIMGAKIIEKHYTIDKNSPGPDHKSSLNPQELKELVVNVRRAEAILGAGVKEPTESEMTNRVRVRKSIVAKHDLLPGVLVEEEDLSFKRPGTGISPDRICEVMGKKALTHIHKNERLVLGTGIYGEESE